MPEYFFHISLELFPNTHIPYQLSQSHATNSHTSKQVLEPFYSHKRRKLSRDLTAYLPVTGHSRHSLRDTREALHVQPSLTSQTIPSQPDDHRLDKISIESTDMATRDELSALATTTSMGDNHVSKGIGTTVSGLQTKGRYVPVELDATDGEWGIIHLYRDSEETPGLYGDSALHHTDLWHDAVANKPPGKPLAPAKDEDCTTLCILAVPSYLTPSDFLAFVGEQTRNEVAHFRMIRTARANRYMVLMKFRHGKEARRWQSDWNGRIFNDMEPETCHVVFLKSVEIIQHEATAPSVNNALPTPSSTSPTLSTTEFSIQPLPSPKPIKPLPPPTSSLIELPTCPVCLERMDETTGLLTILCQHVFHCTCLQKWSGGGCPVCRYTHDDFSSRARTGGYKTKSKKTQATPGGEYELYDDGDLECETCHIESNLWQCLLCGFVGCGRYEAKHAFAHFENSGHRFVLDLESKRVWDYVGDGYVHRIIQDAGNGMQNEKLVELPGRRGTGVLGGNGDEEMQKMENLSLEYTHLLTSQLESQRVYFEEKVERAADKASEAVVKADSAGKLLEEIKSELDAVKARYRKLEGEIVPQLEKERARLDSRAKKFEDMSRGFERGYQREKKVNEGLVERIDFLGKEVETLKLEKAELEESNRDLLGHLMGAQKLQELGDEDIVEGTVIVGEASTGAEGTSSKKKGKGRKK